MGGINRLIHPVEIEQIGLGLVLSTVASLLNLATGLLLAAAPATPDFSGLTHALAALRAHPAVETAAMSTEITPAALPPTAAMIGFGIVATARISGL